MRIVGVIGAGQCDPELAAVAREVGRRLAEAGFAVVTGGLGGVMEAASEGASAAGGTVLGILPGPDAEAANAHVGIAVPTGLGDGRNAVIANTAEAFVSIGGSYGTLTEIAFAAKRGKRVVSLRSWSRDLPVAVAETPEEALRLLMEEPPADLGGGL